MPSVNILPNQTRNHERIISRSLMVQSGNTIYEGTLVGINALGRAIVADTTHQVAGIAASTKVGGHSLTVYYGHTVIMTLPGVVEADIGKTAYAAGNNQLTLTHNTAIVGQIAQVLGNDMVIVDLNLLISGHGHVESVFGRVGVIIAELGDYLHSLVTDDEPEKHRLIDDLIISSTALWSSDKIDSELSGKADTAHTQAASTITDFDTEVSNNADVSANTAARHTHANQTVLDTIRYNLDTIFCTSVFMAAGTPVGSLASLEIQDGLYYSIQEVAATPGFDARFTFVDPTHTFNLLRWLGTYYGSAAHVIKLYVFNVNTLAWDAVTAAGDDFPWIANGADYCKVFNVPAPLSDHYDGSHQIIFRINHLSLGDVAHFFNTDALQLCKRVN